jgi:hypothetical protein
MDELKNETIVKGGTNGGIGRAAAIALSKVGSRGSRR